MMPWGGHWADSQTWVLSTANLLTQSFLYDDAICWAWAWATHSLHRGLSWVTLTMPAQAFAHVVLARRPLALFPSHLNQRSVSYSLWTTCGRASGLLIAAFALQLEMNSCDRVYMGHKPENIYYLAFHERLLISVLNQCYSEEEVHKLLHSHDRMRSLKQSVIQFHCFLPWESLVSKKLSDELNNVPNNVVDSHSTEAPFLAVIHCWVCSLALVANYMWVTPLWLLMSSRVQLKSHNHLWPSPPATDSCFFSTFY